MILETLYTILSSQSPQLTTRIFPSRIPQGQSTPAIVYQRDSTRFLKTFDGHNTFTETSVQIDCYATTVLAAATLANRVKAVLKDYATAPINGVRLDNELDLFEPDTELHRVYLSFTIWHVEA